MSQPTCCPPIQSGAPGVGGGDTAGGEGSKATRGQLQLHWEQVRAWASGAVLFPSPPAVAPALASVGLFCSKLGGASVPSVQGFGTSSQLPSTRSTHPA